MSDNIITGLVARVSDANKWGFYSLKLNDSDTWYGLGKDKPSIMVGSKIKFEAEANAKGFWNVKKGTLIEVATPKESVSNGITAHSMGDGRDTYWSDKAERDIHNDSLREYGATRNTAIEWIKTLLQYEAVKLPVKPVDREAVLQALLTDTIKRFGELNTFKVESQLLDKVATDDPTAAAEDQQWN